MNNSQRIVRGCQHDDLALGEKAEVPVREAWTVTHETQRLDATVLKHPPVVLNRVPGPVEAIQRFFSFTHVHNLADVDTWDCRHEFELNSILLQQATNKKKLKWHKDVFFSSAMGDCRLKKINGNSVCFINSRHKQ